MRWHCNRRNNEEVAQNLASRRAKGFWPVPVQHSAYILPVCSPLVAPQALLVHLVHDVASARLKIPWQKHREFMSQSTNRQLGEENAYSC